MHKWSAFRAQSSDVVQTRRPSLNNTPCDPPLPPQSTPPHTHEPSPALTEAHLSLSLLLNLAESSLMRCVCGNVHLCVCVETQLILNDF